MRDTLPTVQMLLVFEQVTQTGGFARAAQRVNLTPAAVSYQIKRLERLFGAPLFERHADRVTPHAARTRLDRIEQRHPATAARIQRARCRNSGARKVSSANRRALMPAAHRH